MNENGKICLEFIVDGDSFTSAGTASETVKYNLKQLGLPTELIRRAAICMYEGEINMVIHAKGGKAKVCIGKEDIVIELTDDGPGIPDIDQAMQVGFSTAPDKIRALGFGAGMGLPNIKKYSDSIEIESTVGVGTKLKIVLKLEQ